MIRATAWLPLCLPVALATGLLLTPTSRAADVGYAEDFALARDRAAALTRLIPGTEDYYYYHCLHRLNTGQLDAPLQALADRLDDLELLQPLDPGPALRLAGFLGAARREGRAGFAGRVLHGLGWLVLYRPLRVKLGLLRVRDAVCIPTTADPGDLEFFWALGVPVRVGYGRTENTMLCSLSPVGAVRLDSMGRAVAGTANDPNARERGRLARPAADVAWALVSSRA